MGEERGNGVGRLLAKKKKDFLPFISLQCTQPSSHSVDIGRLGSVGSSFYIKRKSTELDGE